MDNYEIITTQYYPGYLDIDVIMLGTKHPLLNFGVGKCDTVTESREWPTAREWVIEIEKDMNQCIVLRKRCADACYFDISVESNGRVLMTCSLKYKRAEVRRLLNHIYANVSKT